MLLTKTPLFAHNHMQRESKRLDPYELSGGTGVVGRMADELVRRGHNVGSFSVDRFSVALVGVPGASGAPMIVNRNGIPEVYLVDAVEENLGKLHNRTSADSGFFAETWSSSLMNSLGINELLLTEMQEVSTNVTFPESYLSLQLETVARLISTREARGTDTDTFYVEIGGECIVFDFELILSMVVLLYS